jgi:hypothetical protein
MNTQRLHAHALLDSIHRTTPGGIRREQFVRRRSPVKAVLSALPFIALAAAAVVVVITR